MVAETQKERRKRWVDTDPQGYMFCMIRAHAKQRGQDFNLEKSDIVIPDVCPVFGTQFSRETRDSTPSIDRLDPTKGYIKGNIDVISFRANRLKNNGTLEDFQQIVKYLLTKQQNSDTIEE